MQDKTIILKALKEDSFELIKKLNSGLLSLKRDPSRLELLKDVLLNLHNLKGLAKVMGFEDVRKLAQRIEDIAKLLNEDRIHSSVSIIDIFIKGVDAIDFLLTALIDNREIDLDLSQIFAQLDGVVKGEKAEVVQDKEKISEGETKERSAVLPSAPFSGLKDSVSVRIDKLDYLLNLSSKMIIDRVCMDKEIEDMETIRELFYGDVQEFYDFCKEWRKYFDTANNNRRLNYLNKLLDKNIKNILDIQGKFLDFFNNHSRTLSHHKLNIDDFQQKLIEIRMSPLSILFTTFPRMATEFAMKYNKEINLVIEGSEIEVDRKIIELLREPLINLLQNAIDHGIEEPAQRIKKGKHLTGKVRIFIKYQGDHLRIEFSDDGQGMDIEKIKKTAIERGFYKEDEIESLDAEDLVNLIFKTGFNAGNNANSGSGRSTGMDLVHKNLTLLNGLVNIESEKNTGTKIKLMIPLSVITKNILIVQAGEQFFGIPSSDLEETLRIYASEIHTIEGRYAVDVRDHIIPLTWLDVVLGITAHKRKIMRRGEIWIFILGSGDKRIAFAVDKFVDEKEVVIKNIRNKFRNIPQVGGITILGSGDLVLVLDPFELIVRAKRLEPRILKEKAEKIKDADIPCILVVDDQMAIRHMEKSVLESIGYKVEDAKDGIDALEKISSKKVDLVITDIQMPNMDGFTFIKKIKETDTHRDIPVIIVSSLEDEENRKKGIELGADAYITKSDFNKNNLHDVIKSLIGE